MQPCTFVPQKGHRWSFKLTSCSVQQLKSPHGGGLEDQSQSKAVGSEQLHHEAGKRNISYVLFAWLPFAQGPCVSLVFELCLLDLGVLLSSCTAPLPEHIFKGLAQQILQAVAACHAAGERERPGRCSCAAAAGDRVSL